MRSRVIAALCALVVVSALPAFATSSAVRTTVARYSFDGRGTGVMATSGRITIGPHAMFADVTVDATDPAHPMAFFGDVIDLSSVAGVRTYGAVGKQSLCSAPLTCQVSNGVFRFSASYTVENDRATAMHLRYYIIAKGTGVVMHDRALLGWTALHRTGGLNVRTDEDAAGLGASAQGEDVGATTGVSTRGPAGGSIAILIPGCDVIGAGALTLSGGVNPPTAVCPSDPVTDVALRATTWSASGAVAGVSANSSRLLVLAR